MQELIQQVITKEKLGKINTIKPVQGGSINSAFQVDTSLGVFFLKANDSVPENYFEVEFKGLELIDKYARTPRVAGTGKVDSIKYLLMEWVDKKRKHPSAVQDLAFSLVQMHRQTSESFGLAYDNYIGTLVQSNKSHDNWADFMSNERILPLAKMAFEKELISKDELWQFELLCNRLNSLIPQEKPALLHGDLYNGNCILSGSKSYFIDPAVYYGHREADIAMSYLFGGLPDKFYGIYHEGFPLQANWEERISLFQIYPLLVHLILFGVAYKADLKEAVEKYL